MQYRDYFSIRMRASAAGRHLSGAERLVLPQELAETAAALLHRAPPAEKLHLTLQRIPEASITRIPTLPVTTVAASGPEEARALATRILVRAGVSPLAIAGAFEALHRTGHARRGASLACTETGFRLDPDPERGVRATHLDYSPETRVALDQALAQAGLTHFRVREALAIASKALWAGVVADLCWSDNPDYPAGYVATREAGYVRFPIFKPPGAGGGRFFFARPDLDVPACRHRLEQQPVLLALPIHIAGPLSPTQFLRDLETKS